MYGRQRKIMKKGTSMHNQIQVHTFFQSISFANLVCQNWNSNLFKKTAGQKYLNYTVE